LHYTGGVDSLATAVADDLGIPVIARRRVSGGDVAESYRLELADGRSVFAKTHRNPPPGFFTTEASGLAWIAEESTVRVPRVLSVADSGPARLVMEWIAEGRAPSDEAEFGRRLAALHRLGAPSFGREDRRTTGSRALPNDPCATWVEFYSTCRLGPLRRLAHDELALPDRALSKLDAVIEHLAQLGGEPEPPARLHGDLWAGNRLVDVAGRSWLIDPAAHGGHREFDLAMMRLFGGFGDQSFTAYQELFPLADGWQARVPLHQLAPLLVHAIKFGGGYVAAAERALDALTP